LSTAQYSARPGSWWGAAAGISTFWLSACVEPDNDGYYEPALRVAALTIDTGESVSLEPGSGVGLGVEYDGDGQWWLTLVCDVVSSGSPCLFDVLATSDDSATGISYVEAVELEADDELLAPDPFAVQLDFLTDADFDGVGFVTTPGATVRLSALLYDPIADSLYDWSDDPRIISWVGSGAVHWGAPTNPVDLTPDRP
jgi:hypothetical protein